MRKARCRRQIDVPAPRQKRCGLFIPSAEVLMSYPAHPMTHVAVAECCFQFEATAAQAVFRYFQCALQREPFCLKSSLARAGTGHLLFSESEILSGTGKAERKEGKCDVM